MPGAAGAATTECEGVWVIRSGNLKSVLVRARRAPCLGPFMTMAYRLSESRAKGQTLGPAPSTHTL